VVYDVAYPIPLTNVTSDYTLGGYAFMQFKFRKKGDSGFIEDYYIGQLFSIYEEGDWEIQFRFPNELPKFD